MTSANPFVTPKYQTYVQYDDNELLLSDPNLRKMAGVHVLDNAHLESTEISWSKNTCHKKPAGLPSQTGK